MSRPLRVGLLQCGHVHPDLLATHGDYTQLFGDLLGPHGVELTTHDVTRCLPDNAGAQDGWLVSGSPDSTYDPLGWIAPLEGFLRRLVEMRAPLVAVCFGHQLLAQAHGGRVERATAGWGAGAHEYELTGAPSWAALGSSGPVRLVASHQDQVVALPPGAEVVASTPHCPVAAFTLGSSALAVQPHPEFTAELSRDLIEVRRDRIGSKNADAALATLDRPLDRDRVAAGMVAFWHRTV
ncbi:GMP synthase [soil metagenome]